MKILIIVNPQNNAPISGMHDAITFDVVCVDSQVKVSIEVQTKINGFLKPVYRDYYRLKKVLSCEIIIKQYNFYTPTAGEGAIPCDLLLDMETSSLDSWPWDSPWVGFFGPPSGNLAQVYHCCVCISNSFFVCTCSYKICLIMKWICYYSTKHVPIGVNIDFSVQL